MATRGQPKAHRLFLLRHAEAANHGTDPRDITRQLTSVGRTQARQVGEFLAGQRIELVLCSTAARARQTAELLALRAPIRFSDRLYNAGSRQLLAELNGVEDRIHTVLVVGHAPGVPALAGNIADPAHSSADALSEFATTIHRQHWSDWSFSTVGPPWLKLVCIWPDTRDPSIQGQQPKVVRQAHQRWQDGPRACAGVAAFRVEDSTVR